MLANDAVEDGVLRTAALVARGGDIAETVRLGAQGRAGPVPRARRDTDQPLLASFCANCEYPEDQQNRVPGGWDRSLGSAPSSR
jgi:hypothetical protein